MSAGLQRTVSLSTLGDSTNKVRKGKAGVKTVAAVSAFKSGLTKAGTTGTLEASPAGFGFEDSELTADTQRRTTNIGWTTLVWKNAWPSESIYGIGVGINLLHNTRKPKYELEVPHTWRAVLFEDLVVYFPYWALLYTAIGAQIAIIYFVRQIVLEIDTSCKDTSYILQLITLLVFSALIWTDLWDSFKMVLYIRWLPLLQPAYEWDLGITEVEVNEHGEVVDFCRDNGITHGIYKRTRALLYTFVIFPKVVIAMGLWWYGCSFLLSSENDADLLLNSVALVFVLEIDEYMAKLVPESTREQVDKFPDYELTAEEFFKVFIPDKNNPELNQLGGKLRQKDLWCSRSNLTDPVFFWSTYGHWIPPVLITTGVFCAQEIICLEENK
eukprot:m.170825 g.170825  ORF g.170825 m.170825 type:complete len:384 (-) comp14802_c0_seq2:1048-2199(-)